MVLLEEDCESTIVRLRPLLPIQLVKQVLGVSFHTELPPDYSRCEVAHQRLEGREARERWTGLPRSDGSDSKGGERSAGSDKPHYENRREMLLFGVPWYRCDNS